MSQCILRVRATTALGCLTTGSKLFDFQRCNMVLAGELLALQGHPVAQLDLANVEYAKVTEMTGSAMFVPSCAIVDTAWYLNPDASWWRLA